MLKKKKNGGGREGSPAEAVKADSLNRPEDSNIFRSIWLYIKYFFLSIPLRDEVMDIIRKGHHRQWADLFINPTSNATLQLGRGALVSFIAFLADYFMLIVLTKSGSYYLVAAGFAYGFGMLINFFASKFIVFNNSVSVVSLGGEFMGYVVIVLIGLGMTEVFILLFHGIAGMGLSGSKVLAALIVFIWNYLARKKFLYREKKPSVEIGDDDEID